MKYLFLSFLILASTFHAFAQDEAETNAPVLKLEKMMQAFGELILTKTISENLLLLYILVQKHMKKKKLLEIFLIVNGNMCLQAS